ncbi:MAG: hypothetical protein S0880_23885 [Actinomycetota bacterium]|nr:hypothetical protein [Actinomycetota bacterium]
MVARRLRRAAVCALALLMTTGVVSGAGAADTPGPTGATDRAIDDGDDGRGGDDEPPADLTRPLGAGAITLAPDGSPATVRVVVPAEHEAVELVGRLIVPSHIVDGTVHVHRDGHRLATIVVPDRSEREDDPTIVIRVPLDRDPDEAQTTVRTVDVELRAEVRVADDDTCPAERAAIELHGAEIAYDRVAADDPTLAAVFGSTIDRVTIVTGDGHDRDDKRTDDGDGDEPTPAEARAAMTVAAAAVVLDPARATEVELAAATPTGAGPLERVVVLTETDDDAEVTASRIDGGGIRLDVTGDAETLADTTRAIATGALGALPHRSVERIDHTPIGAERPRRIPIGDLAAPTVTSDDRPFTAAAPAAAEVTVPVAAWSLGGDRRIDRLRLLGIHTPAPDGAVSRLSIRVNGQLVRSAVIDDDRFDETVDVARHLAARDNEVTVGVEHVPAGDAITSCPPASLVGLTIDPTSWVEWEPWRAAGGLERFPQAAARGLTVAFDEQDTAHLATAVEVVAELQRQAPGPLALVVAPWSDVPGRRAPTLLVATDPDRLATVLDRSGAAEETTGVLVGDARHAAVLAGTAVDDDRPLLVAAAADAEGLRRLGPALRRVPRRLGGISGERVIVTDEGMGEVPPNVADAALDTAADPSPGALTRAAPLAGLAAFALFVAVVTLIARTSYVRRARRSAATGRTGPLTSGGGRPASGR